MTRTDLLKGRTALATGAACRIGREISLALADAGLNIVAHYRQSTNQAEELRKELALPGSVVIRRLSAPRVTTSTEV